MSAYVVSPKTRFVLTRLVHGAVPQVIGEFDTKEEALDYGNRLEALEAAPSPNPGKRWLGLEIPADGAGSQDHSPRAA